jgi:hypothetical protein
MNPQEIQNIIGYVTGGLSLAYGVCVLIQTATWLPLSVRSWAAAIALDITTIDPALGVNKITGSGDKK